MKGFFKCRKNKQFVEEHVEELSGYPKKAGKIMTWLNRRYNDRVEKEASLRLIYGNREKRSRMYNIDKMLEFSGIKRHFNILTAEVLLYMVFIVALISAVISYMIIKKWFMIIIAFALPYAISFILLYVMSGIYYIRLEKNIMTFLNLIENFNKTEDDIVQIIRKTVVYVDNPLKELLRDFCSDAEVLGDTGQAFETLGSKIEHDKCRVLLRNLEVCSRYDSDYGEVIKDCRMSMSDYLSIKAERKAIISNGRIEVIILLVSAVLITMLYNNISEGMWNLLTDTLIGNCILLYCGIVLLICVIMMVLFDKNGG